MFILIVVDNIERHKTGLQARVIDGEIHSFKSYMCVCIYIYIYTPQPFFQAWSLQSKPRVSLLLGCLFSVKGSPKKMVVRF